MASEGRSDLTGTTLGDNWQVDHIVPKVAGGDDDSGNLQAVTASENRTKSCACPPPLWDWQNEFVERWGRSTSENFLLVALPGAGKTVAALTIAGQWIREHPDTRRVLIVVPTDSLRTQWQEEASSRFGLQFQTREFLGFKSSMHGGIVTYQLVAGGSALTFKQLCSRWDVLVICDEIHHAGQNDWGAALKEAVGLSKRRLLMSGTPFRSDRARIPFLEYNGMGICVANYPYDYPDAIRDGVIRTVRFQHDKGIVRRLTAAGEVADELKSDMSEADATDMLLPLLQPGNYTRELLRRSHEQLQECRTHMPEAGALALCIDQRHAEAIAKQLHAITGRYPAVIVSDDEKTNSTVREFRESQQPWVVAVRQVSEGVDIKRLMVLTYLTTTLTQLFFRQAVGRIVRNMRTEHDAEAYCFIPDHPKLVSYARDIIKAQDQAIIEEPEEEFQGRVDRVFSQLSLLPPVIMGTEHTGVAGTIIEGDQLSPVHAQQIREDARALGLSESQALKARKYFRAMATLQPEAPAQGVRAHSLPLEAQLDRARTLLHQAVNRAAHRVKGNGDANYAAVNEQVNRRIGKWRRAEFTLEDLHAAITYVTRLGCAE